MSNQNNNFFNQSFYSNDNEIPVFKSIISNNNNTNNNNNFNLLNSLNEDVYRSITHSHTSQPQAHAHQHHQKTQKTLSIPDNNNIFNNYSLNNNNTHQPKSFDLPQVQVVDFSNMKKINLPSSPSYLTYGCTFILIESWK